MKAFGSMASGYLTPDPIALSQIDEPGKTKDAEMDAVPESGSLTPTFHGHVDFEAVQSKLESLQAKNAQRLLNFLVGQPPGLSNSSLDADTMKETMSVNYQPAAFCAAVPPPPLPYALLQSFRDDWSPEVNAKSDQATSEKNMFALNAKPTKPHMLSDQVVSKGSVGHPLRCAPACRYVKRKGGCRDGENCPSCHHCFWSKANTNSAPEDKDDDANLREAKTLANKLVSLLGGEKPFQDEAVKPEMSLGTMGHPHTCAEACKYVRRKGGCMHGKACPNCHACVWSRSPGQKTQAMAAGLFGSSYGHAVPVQERSGASAGLFANIYGQAAQERDYRSSIIKHDVPIMNHEWGQRQALPTPQGTPQQVPWCPSVGSTGHPYSCNPACKYAMKAKGCKEGAMCDHCHLCRWFRYGQYSGKM